MREPTWSLGGGDIEAALAMHATQHTPCALVRVSLGNQALERSRTDHLNDAREAQTPAAAWRALSSELPEGTVGRRAGWTLFEYVLVGARRELEECGKKILHALTNLEDDRALRWHVVLTELSAWSAERTLLCDAGYDLRAAGNKSVVAWVTPYAGADWRDAQRYPTVTFVELGVGDPL